MLGKFFIDKQLKYYANAPLNTQTISAYYSAISNDYDVIQSKCLTQCKNLFTNF